FQLPVDLRGGQVLVRDGSVSREYPVVGGDTRGELRQHVPLPPLGDHDVGRAELGEFGGDLQGADRAARDEHTPAQVGCGVPVLACGDHASRTGERVEPGTGGMAGDWNLPVATTTLS